jgi:uncharacterized protein
MRWLLTLALPLLLTLPVWPNIQVDGTATAVLVPDQVVVTVQLSTTHPTSLVAAQASNDAMLASVRTTLAKAGLAADAVTASPASSTYTIPASPEGTVAAGMAWTVSRSVVVTLKGAPVTAADVVNAWKNAGHAGAVGIAPGLSGQEAKMDELRALALADAKRRADLYARGAGQVVTGLVNLTERSATVSADGKTASVAVTAVYGNK